MLSLHLLLQLKLALLLLLGVVELVERLLGGVFAHRYFEVWVRLLHNPCDVLLPVWTHLRDILVGLLFCVVIGLLVCVLGLAVPLINARSLCAVGWLPIIMWQV